MNSASGSQNTLASINFVRWLSFVNNEKHQKWRMKGLFSGSTNLLKSCTRVPLQEGLRKQIAQLGAPTLGNDQESPWIYLTMVWRTSRRLKELADLLLLRPRLHQSLWRYRLTPRNQLRHSLCLIM